MKCRCLGETENLYVDSDVKILAVMYGILDGSEGSCDWAVAVIEFSDEVKNWESESHFRPAGSVAAEPPQVITNESEFDEFADLTAGMKIEKEIKENKMWVLEIMDFGKYRLEEFEKGDGKLERK